MREKYPFLMLCTRDFLASAKVQVMSCEEVGAYTLMLLHAWQFDPAGHLPADEEFLARLCRLTPEQWGAVKRRVMACWKTTDAGDLIFNERLLATRQDAEARVSKLRESGRKRWGAHEPGSCQAHARLQPGSCQAQAGLSKEQEQAQVKEQEHGLERVPSGFVMEFLMAWNALGEPFAHVKDLGPRQTLLEAAWRDAFFRDHWAEALRAMAASSFCRGGGPRAWVADIGWFLKPASVRELCEGKHKDRAPAARPSGRVSSFQPANNKFQSEVYQ